MTAANAAQLYTWRHVSLTLQVIMIVQNYLIYHIQ